MAWTTPKTFAAGDQLTASELNTHLRDNMNALTSWTSYTPTWSATGGTPTIGNGTLEAKYIEVGDVCIFRMRLVIGSTSSLGTTTLWEWTFPSTPTEYTSTLTAQFKDESTGIRYIGHAYTNTTTFSVAIADAATANNTVGYAKPVTWATSDTLVVSGIYVI